MLNEKQIEAAVNWWADAIANPNFDNGDPSQTGGMCMVMAISLKEGISEEQVEKFKEELTAQLSDEGIDYHGLSVDYGPCRALSDAMRDAGISPTNAPWKTDMMFCPGGVIQVSYGYGAPYKQVYPEPSKVVPKAGRMIEYIQYAESLRGSDGFGALEEKLDEATAELDELEGMMDEKELAEYSELKKDLGFEQEEEDGEGKRPI